MKAWLFHFVAIGISISSVTSISAGPNIAKSVDGEAAYQQNCSACHGRDLTGGVGPALRGAGFISRWHDNGTALQAAIRAKMPPTAPGTLGGATYSAITAFLMSKTVPILSPTQSATPAAVSLPMPPIHQGAPSTDVPDDAELLHPADGDWLFYNRDYLGQRFSPLTQITPANAKHLQPKCVFQPGELGSFQASPVVRDGWLYVTNARHTFAIDAATCKTRWIREYVPTGAEYDFMPTNRGVALYKGMVIRGTLDGHLIAMDAKNGAPIWDVRVADGSKGYFLSAMPVVFDGKVYTGEAGADYGASGHVHAFDAMTGRSLWTFNIIPKDGEPGRETWPNRGTRRGGSMWTTITVDPKTRTLYGSTGNPSTDFYGNDRKGDNLYTDSVIALDSDTGKLKWFVQQVPHDDRDWDTAAAPMLYSSNGRNLMAVGSKDGRLYFYDRDTHGLLAHRDLVPRLNATGPLPPGKPTRVCPAAGVEWNGPAFDPLNGLVFINAIDWCYTITPESGDKPEPYGGRGVTDPAESAHGWLRAFDATTQNERWSYHTDGPMMAGVTPTASGVLFTGTASGDFFAFETKTGTLLYTFYTGGAVAGGVSTYLAGGHQYVAVLSGNSSKLIWKNVGSPIVVIFGLP